MKYLLAERHDGKGIFLFTDNDYKFVIASIENNNGIGNAVSHWSSGSYFKTLKEAWEVFNRGK